MDIKDFRDKHKGGECFILGNGPSLKDVDLSQLEGRIVFGTNRIYLSGFTPTYYVAVNPLIIQQFWDDIKEVDAVKFVPNWAFESMETVPPKEEHAGEYVSIDTSLGVPLFSSPEGPIWEGYTVTFVAMQLAYYMGFDRVVLLGLDHYYGEHEKDPNKEVISQTADEYHFDPNYFGKGIRWHNPDIKMSEIAYALAQSAFAMSGRVIMNASSKTACDIFPIIPLRQVLDPRSFRVSAIVSAYYAKDFLKGRIEDLLAQTERHEIIIVCKRGSPEAKIAWEYYDDKNDAMTIVETPDIPTVYHAWNLGIKQAHGRYITNANCDDRLAPMAYEIMADILDGRPDIDLIYPDVFITWDTPMTFEDFLKQDAELKPGRWEGKPGFFSWREYDRSALGAGCFIGPMPMWRHALHQRHGGFIDEWKSAGDYEFWLRCSKHANYLHYPGAMGVYCARADGIELSNPVESERETLWAQSMHQYHGELEYFPLQTSVRVRMGDEYSYVHYEHFNKLVDIIQKKRGKNAADA